jgi:carbamoyltransferase
MNNAMPKNILGLKVTSHDTGAALLSGGKIVAIAEERLTRIKHSPNIFPHLSIDYCLGALNLTDMDIALVVIDQLHSAKRLPMEEIFRKETGDRFAHAAVQVINHHDAHAASAFFCSPFDEAAVLVYDSAGEEFGLPLGVSASETETIYYGKGNTLVEMHKSLHTRLPYTRQFLYTFGIGRLYESITNYLGFGFYQEGKTMGLAPYGKPGTFSEAPEENWWKEWRGQYLCNADIRFPKTLANEKALLFSRLRFGIKARLYRRLARFAERLLGVDKERGAFFERPLSFSRPRRSKDVKLPDEYYTNVAYAVQDVLETVVKGWARKAKSLTRAKYLCIAGGVGLNSVANKKILDECGFDDVWIQPGCSDTGIPLGCVLYGYHVLLGKPRFWKMNHAYIGRIYSDAEIEHAVSAHGKKISMRRSENVAQETARLLSDGKIIGWFQGGSEYGPRALGHRSILVDARGKQVKDILNSRVKHREGWRPFAASVLKEYVEDYFDVPREAGGNPFMLLVADVKKPERIPAVTHVDGTCRIQTVTREDNGVYYNLIRAFYELTDIPLVLNTSFNVAGEPIIETPEDALRCFLGTDMDYLVLGDYIVQKRV